MAETGKLQGFKKELTPLWHALDLPDVYRRLQTTQHGLSERDAEIRRAQFGKNEIAHTTRFGNIRLFFGQFKSAFVYILLIAAVISFVLHDAADGWVILATVIMNTIIGFFQEKKAKNSLDALRKAVSVSAKVFRGQEIREINAADVVPGDVLFLAQGDRVPADVRLIESRRLLVNEAAFTGEALDVAKISDTVPGDAILQDQKNSAFMGSLVTSGTGIGVVVRTGMRTVLGSLSLLLKAPSELTPLQKKLSRFGKQLGMLVLLLTVAIFCIGLLSGIPFVHIFLTAVSIAVSAIPEGLMIAVTVTMAIGMRRILDKRGLVKSLPAAETLGSTTLICTDKTGTLTTGEMRVWYLKTLHHTVSDVTAEWFHELETHPKELVELIKMAVLCNDAYFEKDEQGVYIARGNMTDRAIAQFAPQLGIVKEQMESRHVRLDTLPFDSGEKFMATLHEYPDHALIALKGSPERTLAFCTKILSDGKEYTLDQNERRALEREYQTIAASGLRVLGVAYKKVDKKHGVRLRPDALHDLVCVGFIGIKDPVRHEVRESIARLKQSFVATVMVTGDNRETARAIAEEVGIWHAGSGILESKDMAQLSDVELDQQIQNISVFARITPEDKVRIVASFRRVGNVVAMTGDGVNDAPALHSADIGIAVGTGTEVAKEAADLILLDNSFSIIEAALYEGRVIYANLKKTVFYFLSNSFTELSIVTIGILLHWPLPLLAPQILWINLIADGLPALSLTKEPVDRNIIAEHPQEKDKPILDGHRKALVGIISGSIGLVAIGLFLYYWHGEEANLTYARTTVFTLITVSSLLYIFNVRDLGTPLLQTPLFANRFLIVSVAAGFLLQYLAVSLPFLQSLLGTTALRLGTWVTLILFGVGITVLIEGYKRIFILGTKS